MLKIDMVGHKNVYISHRWAAMLLTLRTTALDKGWFYHTLFAKRKDADAWLLAEKAPLNFTKNYAILKSSFTN